MSLVNNVKCTLNASVAIGASTVQVIKAVAPHQDPPTDGVITLIDNIANPNNIEVIAYTGRTDNTTYWTLTGVSKAQEGTTDQAWSAGDVIFQDVTAAFLNVTARTSVAQTWTANQTFPAQSIASSVLADAGLRSLSSLVGISGSMIYATTEDAYAITPSTAYGRGLLNTVDADTLVTALALTLNDISEGTTDGGTGNIGLGNTALSSITSGSYNVAIGTAAGNNLTSGSNNTLLGRQAGSILDTDNAVAVGYEAGKASTAALTAIGTYALDANTSGTLNTAVGINALGQNTTGQRNTAIGDGADANRTTGDRNITVGANAGSGSGSRSVAVGNSSGGNGDDRVAIGDSAGTADGGSLGIAIGTQALAADASAGTIGIGYQAGMAITTAVGNSLVGYQAGKGITSAGNTVFGYNALSATEVSGVTENVAIGYDALQFHTTGGLNTALGHSALAASTSGTRNTALGSGAGAAVTTGDNNTFMGAAAGGNVTSGSSNIIIGDTVSASEADGDFQLNIGGLIRGNLQAAKINLGEDVSEILSLKGYQIDDTVLGKVSVGSMHLTSNAIPGTVASHNYITDSIGASKYETNGATHTFSGAPAPDLTPVTAGSFSLFKWYRILTTGTTDFTLIGAPDSNVGTYFLATGVGAGTGTAALRRITWTDYLSMDADGNVAIPNGNLDVTGTATATDFTISGAGTLTASATTDLIITAVDDLRLKTGNGAREAVGFYDDGASVSATFGGNVDVTGTMTATSLDIGGTLVTATATELNLLGSVIYGEATDNAIAIGDTLQAWYATDSASLQVGYGSIWGDTDTAFNYLRMGVNIHVDASGFWKHINTGYAPYVDFSANSGDITFFGTTSEVGGTNVSLDTVLKLASNGDISFYEDTGTTAKLFWDASAESLGIGSTDLTSYATKLGIKGSETNLRLLLENTVGERWELNSASSGKFYIGNSSANVVILDSAGNVGIGTTSPAAKLDVNGTLACDGFTSTGIDDNATSTAITIDASENVGIGVVPESDWGSAYSAMQIGSYGTLFSETPTTSGRALVLGHNAKYTTDWHYIRTDEASIHIEGDGQHIFKVAPSGTADSAISWTTGLTIENNADVNVNTGNLVIGTSGKGIDFSADGNAAGMTSEVLDDYEEGTHALALTPATSGSITLNTSYDTLKYVKIGNLVFVSGRVEVSSVSSPVGGVGFSLPFAAAATPNGRTASAVTFRGLDIPAAAFNIAITVNGGASSAYLSTSEDNTANWPAIDGTAFSGDERFYFSLTYQTD